jgi:tryptophanyl-tRNA synthetase
MILEMVRFVQDENAFWTLQTETSNEERMTEGEAAAILAFFGVDPKKVALF